MGRDVGLLDACAADELEPALEQRHVAAQVGGGDALDRVLRGAHARAVVGIFVERELAGVGLEIVEGALVVRELEFAQTVGAGALGDDFVEEWRGAAGDGAAAEGPRVNARAAVAGRLPKVHAAAQRDGHAPEEIAPRVEERAEVHVGRALRIVGHRRERVAVEAQGIDREARDVVDDRDDARPRVDDLVEADGHAGAAGDDAEELALVGAADVVLAVGAADAAVEFPDRPVVAPVKGGHISAVFADAAVAARVDDVTGAGDALGKRRRERARDDLRGVELEVARGGPAVERRVLVGD